MIDEGNQLCWNRPNWLRNHEEWSPNLKTTASMESNEELKLTKQVFALATEEDNNFVKLLSKFVYWKTLRVIVWLLRFVGNTLCITDQKVTGPLTTSEIEKAEKLLTQAVWVTRSQSIMDFSLAIFCGQACPQKHTS